MPFDAQGRGKTPRRTNAEMLFAVSSMLCEHEPSADRPAMLSDPYHGLATVDVGQRYARADDRLRVCADCAARFFSGRPQRPLRSPAQHP